MQVAERLLRQARRTAGLSQRDLASRAGVSQPTVAAAETGTHDPGAARLERLLIPAGHCLTILPTQSRTAADAADAVFLCLKQGDEERAFREVIQLSDDLCRESGAIRVALTVTKPAPVGDRRYDALIAAVVEHHLRSDGLPLPTWLSDPTRILTEPWFVDPASGVEELVRSSTPESFARRNVFMSASELESV